MKKKKFCRTLNNCLSVCAGQYKVGVNLCGVEAQVSSALVPQGLFKDLRLYHALFGHKTSLGPFSAKSSR